jgi:uncharacterized protein (TIGR00369 family)
MSGNPLLALTPDRAQHYFLDIVPQSRALEMRLIEYGADRIVIDLPYHERLIGDPDSGVIHGGAITTLLDAACGAAVMAALRELRRIATLDLRIDYLRPAHVGRAVRCRAECYRITHQVAFVRASAHDGDADDVLATAAGTFAVFEQRVLLTADGLEILP